jgi:hypothetical protein
MSPFIPWLKGRNNLFMFTPILTYGSEVWGVDSTFKDSDPFEKLHIKFFKEILGIHCKAFNDGCRAETKQNPFEE